jgi:hypothetical protein
MAVLHKDWLRQQEMFNGGLTRERRVYLGLTGERDRPFFGRLNGSEHALERQCPSVVERQWGEIV